MEGPSSQLSDQFTPCFDAQSGKKGQVIDLCKEKVTHTQLSPGLREREAERQRGREGEIVSSALDTPWPQLFLLECPSMMSVDGWAQLRMASIDDCLMETCLPFSSVTCQGSYWLCQAPSEVTSP